MSDMKPFTASQRWLHRARKRLGLKGIKITAFASEEAAAKFLAELRKLIGDQYFLQFQTSPGGLGTYPLWVMGELL